MALPFALKFYAILGNFSGKVSMASAESVTTQLYRLKDLHARSPR